MKQQSVKMIVISAMGLALVFLATYLLKIPNGIQGYFNLGDGFIMLFASIVNPFMAFLIGGIGSALADIAGGYGVYAIWTFAIKGLEGIIVALAFQHMKSNMKYLSYGIGALLMVSGYLVTDSVINQSWALGISGIPANLLQGGAGIIIALIALPLIKRNIRDI